MIGKVKIANGYDRYDQIVRLRLKYLEFQESSLKNLCILNFYFCLEYDLHSQNAT